MSVDDLFAGAGSPPPPTSRPEKSSSRGGDEVLVRLDTEGDCPVLYTLVQTKPNAFSLLATDGRKGWTGALARRRLEETAKKVKMEVEELVEVTGKALTREKLGDMEFLYTSALLERDGEERLELVWKKHLVAGNIKVQLGSLLMEPHQPHVVICRMLEHAISKIAGLQTGIEELSRERVRLVDERTSALQRLDKCVSLKEELETDLYGKFKIVLNEKKAKVRRLMESLSYLSSQQQQAKETETSASRGGGGGVGDGSEVDTDDEAVSPTPSPKSKQTPSSPSHTAPSEEGVSSLLKNDWQDDSTSPPVKRRKREPRRTAGRPEIPRSTRSISSSSSASDRLQSAAGKNEDSLESDDLLNLL